MSENKNKKSVRLSSKTDEKIFRFKQLTGQNIGQVMSAYCNLAIQNYYGEQRILTMGAVKRVRVTENAYLTLYLNDATVNLLQEISKKTGFKESKLIKIAINESLEEVLLSEQEYLKNLPELFDEALNQTRKNTAENPPAKDILYEKVEQKTGVEKITFVKNDTKSQSEALFNNLLGDMW